VADPLLQITDLRKSFGGVTATDGVNLSVEKNEIHAVIGPNGAGKTTLIAQLSGDVMPDSGRVEFAGRDITGLPAHRRAHRGLARSFQITSVFLGLSVIDNVALAVQAHKGHSFRFWQPAATQMELRKPALDMLERVGLSGRAGTLASALSHGERRQLEIAMALAGNPRFMLLDEPMAGMGAEESAAMVAFLDKLKGQHTILLVEHDMDVVFALADRISVLVYGRIIATGKPEDIRNDAQVRDAYLGEA
jgi:branched-chain amino acid transport system ATP-binding protein